MPVLCFSVVDFYQWNEILVAETPCIVQIVAQQLTRTKAVSKTIFTQSKGGFIEILSTNTTTNAATNRQNIQQV